VARCVAENSSGDISATLPVSKDGKSLEFDPVDSMFAFPGGANKFTLRYDAKSKRYWAIVNKQKEPFALLNRQVLVSSNNLRDWKINSVLYHHLDYYRYGKHDA